MMMIKIGFETICKVSCVSNSLSRRAECSLPDIKGPHSRTTVSSLTMAAAGGERMIL